MAEGGASKLKAVIIGGTGATGKNIIGDKDKVETGPFWGGESLK